MPVFFGEKFCNVMEKLYLCRTKIKKMEKKDFFEALFGLLSEVSDALRELADELEGVKYDYDSPNVTITWDTGQYDGVCCHGKKRLGCGFNIDEPLFEEEDCHEEYLRKRRLFDEFVKAGEKCEEAGMAHDESVPFFKF